MNKQDENGSNHAQDGSNLRGDPKSRQAMAMEMIGRSMDGHRHASGGAGKSCADNVIDWSKAGMARRRPPMSHRGILDARRGARVAERRLRAGTACMAYVPSEDRLHAAHLTNEADHQVRDFIPGWGRSRHLCAIMHRPSGRVVSFGYGDCCLDARAAAYRALARTSGKPRNVARWLMEANTYDALRSLWLRRRKSEA